MQRQVGRGVDCDPLRNGLERVISASPAVGNKRRHQEFNPVGIAHIQPAGQDQPVTACRVPHCQRSRQRRNPRKDDEAARLVLQVGILDLNLDR